MIGLRGKPVLRHFHDKTAGPAIGAVVVAVVVFLAAAVAVAVVFSVAVVVVVVHPFLVSVVVVPS